MTTKSSNARSVPIGNDDIVISGIAGRFPDSDNVHQLKENLMNKVDLVSEDDRRWKLDHPEIPRRSGKINNLDKFDSVFFGVNFKQADAMDPMGRSLMEHAYEAIVDAGFNPRHLRGTKTGVFIATSVSETELTILSGITKDTGLSITGLNRSMLANRISYWLDIKGPSHAVDSACSSTHCAMDIAYRAIRNGECDAALVGGANLCLNPYMALQFARLGVLSPDGRSKTFDDDANGYVRSEAVGLVFLQKAKDAKRIYATYVHGKINCDGYKEQAITFPSMIMQATLLKECYEECGLSPTVLNYMEAHGTGTRVGDPEEVAAIDKVICTGRTTPLKIGSVKSNLGHAEPACGICSIAKVVIAMETGLIPPNLHYKRPREGIKALEDGRIKVVTEVTPWEGGYAGINGFGFGGANAHILLKSNPKEKIKNGAPEDDLPRLVVTSGRTDEAVNSILNDVENRPVDVEFTRLLHDIHSDDIPGHMYRGYTIVGGSASQDNWIREIKDYPGGKRPVWFVFSGMGSQWAGMGTALLRLPIFAEAVKKCDAVLKPRRIDIYDILTTKDKSTFDNVLNSFVGIAAIQIGLVDLLTHIGIVPDKIIGHSVGELGCAYADGCFTAEQMILAAYSRGLASIETDTIRGSMAAVGLGYDDVKGLCPPDIEVACHNGPGSSTISGPADSMRAFVAKLQVPCSNIAYHSRYVAKMGPTLLAYLRQVIPQPKPRSPKWVSTSLPRSDWAAPLARLSSAEYHTNNLLSSVLFEETSQLIPKDAVTIEIAPHGLLQAILRRSLPPEVVNVGLTQRDHRDNVEFFLQGLGKLFNVGLNPHIAKLYPDIQFPVGRGTPMIAPLIKWEHSDDFFVYTFRTQDQIQSGERIVHISIAKEEYEYMAGHVIDGRNLLPATGYLTLIWETFSMMRDELYGEVPVVFEDVKFLRATTIPKEGTVELCLMVQKGTGRFEVVEGGAAVVTGMIRQSSNPSLEMMGLPIPNDDDDVVEEMVSKDIYKELRIRGYNYSGMFRAIKSSTIDATKGTIVWENNWVAFMDNMLQMTILDGDSRGLFVPTGIRKLTIDTKSHLEAVRASASDEKQFTARRYKDYDVIIAGGIEIRGLTASAISRRKPAGEPVLETYQFVANRDKVATTLKDFVRISAHICIENIFSVMVKTVEYINDTAPILENLVSVCLVDILRDWPLIQADVNVVAPDDHFADGSAPDTITIVDPKKLDAETAATIVSGRDLFKASNADRLNQLLLALKNDGFLLALETGKPIDIYAVADKNSLDIILEKRVDNATALLLRKHRRPSSRMTIINVSSNNFEWLPRVKSALEEATEAPTNSIERIILVSDRDFENGLLGMVNCLRREPGGEIVRGYLIQDKHAPDFSKDNSLYADQLRLDLGLNVLRSGGKWGTYRHLQLPEIIERPTHHGWSTQLIRGDLSSFRWLEGPLKLSSDKKNLVRVVYAPINFRDVMLATGKLAIEVVAKDRHLQECVFGLEFAGIDGSGRRLMGLLESRGFANIVETDASLLWTVPDAWSLEEAATVPCVYMTCFYALYCNGKMKRGDKVLIHAGTGGVGQAAINLALHEGCEVFTTVGTPEKRRFIRERFPQIDDNHIGNSRDTSFEHLITRQTKGRGVDIVLNSLADEKLRASVRCLAKRGRFLEIGKFDLAADNPLGMKAFLREITFCGVMLDNLMSAGPEAKKEVSSLMQRGLDRGAVKPLTYEVFSKDEMETAFRHMAAGKHIGKVLIAIRDKSESLDGPIMALPRFHCPSEGSYVIIGGLGGFGLELADWLVLRGARNLVLTSRTGIRNGYQSKRVSLWKSYGTKVIVAAGKEVYKPKDCEDILKTAAKLGPIDGIFNVAVVLNDALMSNQTEAKFEEAFRAKAWGTQQLDRASRMLCPKLRLFVVFSSVVCGRGNPGQTNYGMSNSTMERICESRVAAGLPGLAIQWGAVGDVGLVADMQDDDKELIIGGTLQQRISSCLAELDKFLTYKAPIVSSMVVAEKRAGGSGALTLIEMILNIMGLKDLKKVSPYTSLAELGMDSLMAVEIKQTLEREFEIFLIAQDIRALNFAKISDMSAKGSAEDKRNGESTTDDETVMGMKLFVQLLGEKELIHEDCVKMQTREEAGRDEVFLIPGIEGYANVFNNLAGKIKSPATCLQLIGSDTKRFTIVDMAEKFVPHVLKRIKNSRNFVIAGYSYGSVVAIELARKLETKGLTGRLVLIDGSPELLKTINDQRFSIGNEDEIQSHMLLHIMDIMSPAIKSELAVELKKCKTWSEKLDAFMNLTPTGGATNVTQDEQKFLCSAIFNRLAVLQHYDHTDLPPLRSSIILVKPSAETSKSVSPDYGLGKITREKVEIFTVEGNHLSIIENSKIATIIDGGTLGGDSR